MKTLTALILLVGFSMSSITNNDEGSDEEVSSVPITIKVVDDSKALFRYETEPDGPIMIRIFDEYDRLIKTQALQKDEAFAKYYDFSQLDQGDYTVKVYEQFDQVGEMSLSVPNLSEKSKNFNASIIDKNGDALKLFIENQERSDLVIKVFENDLLVHEESLAPSSVIERQYKLMGFKPQSQISILVADEEGHSEWISVQ